MKYEIKNYSHLQNIGEISNEAMNMHFKLYEGYVNNINTLLEKMNVMEKNTPEWNELHRRFGWEFNGMRLHELFFDGLTIDRGGGAASAAQKNFEQKITVAFGTFENWKKDFESISKIRGMGWAMLVQDRKTKTLLNTWVNEHDAGMLADVNIILNFDMFEHAYIKDFSTDRQAYLDSLFQHLNWEVLNSRVY